MNIKLVEKHGELPCVAVVHGLHIRYSLATGDFGSGVLAYSVCFISFNGTNIRKKAAEYQTSINFLRKNHSRWDMILITPTFLYILNCSWFAKVTI